jgi:hypothetical protein
LRRLLTGVVTWINWHLGGLVRHGGHLFEGFAMDAMAKFVIDHNVERFVDQLRSQSDPTIRTVLQRLLLEEVRKFGFNLEQLSMVDRQLSEARARIRAQKKIIEGLRINGRDTMRAEHSLGNLVGIQGIFEQYRQVIVNTL